MKKAMTIAVAAAAALTVSSIDSTAASTVTLKDGKLVYVSTSKIVSGYKVYKKKLYKDGVLAKGRVKYGTGANMKLYKDGKLEKGIYVTANSKYIFKDGSLIKGVYKYETNRAQDLIFKDGVLTNQIIVDNGKLYDNGKLKKGAYVISEYEPHEDLDDDRLYLFLYVDGVLAKGIQQGTYHNETLLFKNGEQPNFFYNGKVYVEGKIAPRDTHILCDDGKLYYNDALFTGTYNNVQYENGVRLYHTIVKQYEDALDDILALASQIGTTPDADLAATIKTKTTDLLALLTKEKSTLYKEYGGGVDEDGEYLNPENTTCKIGGQLQSIIDLAKQLNGEANDTISLLESTLTDVYDYADLYYRDGKLLDGVVDGYLYENGKRIDVALNVALERATANASSAYSELKRAVDNDDDAKVKTALPAYIQASEKAVGAAIDLLEEAKNPTYPNVSLNESFAKDTIRSHYQRLELVYNAANTYALTPHLTSLHSVLKEGYALLGETISFEEPDPNATYVPTAINEVQDGTFDDQGYAYFKVTTTDIEGNYTCVGNADAKNYATWLANSAAQLQTAPQMQSNKVRYLQKGTYYLLVKGQPNKNYHFKLKKRTYNYETLDVLPAAKNDYDRQNVVKLPYYLKQKVSTKIHLTTDQHLQILALPSSTTPVEEIILTNTKTNKTYPVQKLSKARFSSNAPNGTYELTIKPAAAGNGQHVAIRYVLSPTLKMNTLNENGYRDTYTLNVKRDTKFEFTLSDNWSKQLFKIYDDQHQVVKKVTLGDQQRTRTFRYTLKKGRYSVKAPMSVTPKIMKEY